MDVTARFAELATRQEDHIPLDETALLIAARGRPEVDVAAELARLDELASGCPEPTFEGWRRHLFVHLGFSGNVGDYHDPANSFLDQVMTRRAGIPISLAVLGMEVGRRLGLRFRGVGMPGHFLLRHEGSPEVFVDAFERGRVLDEAGCEERFRATHGPELPFSASYLEPVGTRAILSRMLANLKSVYARRGELDALGWVLELRLAIPGTPPLERRDVARVLTASGRFREAAAELETLAAILPERAEALRKEAVELRARLN